MGTLQLAKADSRLIDNQQMFDHMQDFRALAYGRIWSAKPASVVASFKDVAEGSGVLVAVADAGDGNRMTRSEDGGLSWSPVTLTGDFDVTSIAFGDGVFVAVGPNSCYRSVDLGETWLSVSGGSGIYVRWDGSSFVTCSGGLNPIIFKKSVDAGASWQTVTHDLDWVSGGKLRYANGRYMVVRDGEAAISENLINWTPISTNASTVDIAYANGRYVLCRVNTAGMLYSDDDGNSWLQAPTPAALFSGIDYVNGVFIAYTENQPYILVSPNGVDWRQILVPESNHITRMISMAGRIIAVCANGGSQIFISDV